jgi:hypothetical protein
MFIEEVAKIIVLQVLPSDKETNKHYKYQFNSLVISRGKEYNISSNTKPEI